MENQSIPKANNNLNDDDMKNFKWTVKLEKCLLMNMIGLKPCGINKHLNILLLQEKMKQELKQFIPTKAIWQYLESKWNIQAADIIENTNFDTSIKEFVLPIEYEQLIIEEREKIKNEQDEQCLKRKRKLSGDSGKEKLKSHSVETKDNSNDPQYQTSTLSENLVTNANEDLLSEVNIRRSLRCVEKVENVSNKKQLIRTNTKSDEVNKSIDLKLLNENKKRKTRNVSESSFSSDNSKNPKNYKNNVTDLIVYNRSPRSITPEILPGKATITSKTKTRKSNLRSNDKDHKSKLTLKKSYKMGSNVDHSKPKKKIEHSKAEKYLRKNAIFKNRNSKHPILKNKNKIRERLTSDQLVAQQIPDRQSLGKRSCSIKNT